MESVISIIDNPDQDCSLYINHMYMDCVMSDSVFAYLICHYLKLHTAPLPRNFCGLYTYLYENFASLVQHSLGYNIWTCSIVVCTIAVQTFYN